MRKNKKEAQKKKKEKLIIKKTLEEQIAKNAEDDKKILNLIINQNSSPSQNINNLYNSYNEKKIENHIRHLNKFDLEYSEISDKYNDNDSQEESKDSTNELNQSEGLYVILTYFPVSEKVEKQALRRAGRKGENGSDEL